MKTTLLLGALFIFILVGGFLWKGLPMSTQAPAQASEQTVTSSAEPTTAASSTTTSSSATNTSTKNTSAPTAGTYTAAQVATHNSTASCWTSINGGVYNLTSWISQHPGGPEHIESICGIDGTSAFEGQHSGDSQANAMLATFKIGTLSK
jgi:cytochrome b involved in lipid metabolism